MPLPPTAYLARFAVAADGTFSAADDLVRLLGFAAAEVQPTLAVLEAHVHPDDRGEWRGALAGALRGNSRVVWHRIVTAADRERAATTTLIPRLADGRVVAADGVLADLTDPLRGATAVRTTAAVDRAVATRAPVEQAKGILMAVLDVDADQAFDLLRWHSSHANVKVSEVGRAVVEQMSAEAAPAPPRQRLAAVFAGLGERSAAEPAARPGWVTKGADRPAGAAGDLAVGRLPAALLPRVLTRAVADASVCITIADVLAPDQPLVYVNEAFERLTGYAAAEVLGRNCRFLQRGDRDETQTAALRAAMAAGDPVDALVRNYRADGSMFYNEFHLSPVRNQHDRVTHYIGYQLDVTERVEREQALERLAFRDPATNLPNLADATRQVERLLGRGSPGEIDLVAVRWERFGVPDATRAGDAVEAGDLGDASVRRLLPAVAHRLREQAADLGVARVAPDVLLLFGPPGTVPADDELLRLVDPAVRLGRVRAPGDGLTAPNLIDQALLRSTDRRASV